MHYNISNYIISHQFFGSTLELPTTGLINDSDLLDGNSDIWKAEFFITGYPISIPVEKHDLKPKFCLLSNIVAKALLAKAGSYDKITKEKFLCMALIVARIGVNWSGILFSTLCEMTRVKGQS